MFMAEPRVCVACLQTASTRLHALGESRCKLRVMVYAVRCLLLLHSDSLMSDDNPLTRSPGMFLSQRNAA